MAARAVLLQGWCQGCGMRVASAKVVPVELV